MKPERIVLVLFALLGGDVLMLAGCATQDQLQEATQRAEQAVAQLQEATQVADRLSEEKARLEETLNQRSLELAQLQDEYTRAQEQMTSLRKDMDASMTRQKDTVAKAKALVTRAATLEKQVQAQLQAMREWEQLSKDLQVALNALQTQLAPATKPKQAPAAGPTGTTRP